MALDHGVLNLDLGRHALNLVANQMVQILFLTNEWPRSNFAKRHLKRHYYWGIGDSIQKSYGNNIFADFIFSTQQKTVK